MHTPQLAPLALAVLVAACGGKPNPTPAPTATAPPPTTSAPTAPTATTAPAPDAGAAPAPADASTPASTSTSTTADAGPTPPAPADALPFASLRALPLTLQYSIEGTGMACQLTDAGLEGDADFKVKCTPEKVEWCLSDTYFGDIPSAAGMWSSEGCYLVTQAGLWHFATCPAGDAVKAAKEAPDKNGGELAIAADILTPPAKPAPKEGEPPTEPEEGVVKFDGVMVHGKSVPCRCVEKSDAGMSKSLSTTVCTSPDLGYTLVVGSLTEAESKVCEDMTILLEAEPGLHEPRTCLVEPSMVGTWRFTTAVAQAKDKKALGAQGNYVLDVKMGDKCTLTATLEKRGIDGKAFAPEAIQSGSGTFVADCDLAPLSQCRHLALHLADKAGKGFDAEYFLTFDQDSMTGAWQYTQGDGDATGYVGLLRGARGAGDPAAYKDADIDLGLRCNAKDARVVAGPEDHVFRFGDSEGYWDCTHPEPPPE